ncbi:MAG: hypothetical protein ACLTOM_10495 [Roseburia sp.]
MVGLGILTSLVDGVSFGSMQRSAIFTGSMEEPALPQNLREQRVFLSPDAYYVLLFVLHLYCTILAEENYA